MTNSIKAAFVAGLLASGALVSAATAQTSTTNSPAVSPMSTQTTPPSLGASGRPATAPRTDATAPAAVTTTEAPSRTSAAPVAGANSYTEGQARARIAEKGFGEVHDLKKDDKGVWRGTAMKDGKSVAVALDYQGNIVSQ